MVLACGSSKPIDWSRLEKRSQALLTTQPDEGYPGSGAPMARQAPDSKRRQGPFVSLPLDTGPMPKKIQRRSRILAGIAGPGTLQPDEPKKGGLYGWRRYGAASSQRENHPRGSYFR